MTTNLSQAQSVQQGNRTSDGKYTFGTHAEPDLGISLSPAPHESGNVPQIYQDAFKGMQGSLKPHPLRGGSFIWQSPEHDMVTVGADSFGEHPYTAFASHNSAFAEAHGETPRQASEQALQQAAMTAAFEQAGLKYSDVEVDELVIDDNRVSLAFHNANEHAQPGRDSRPPGEVSYRIEGDLVNGRFDVSAQHERGIDLKDHPQYTEDAIMRRATGGVTGNASAFIGEATNAFAEDKYAGLDLATQLSPPVEEAHSEQRDNSSAWHALVSLSENSRLHDSTDFDPRTLQATEVGRAHISVLLALSRKQLSHQQSLTARDRRYHLRNLMENARDRGES